MMTRLIKVGLLGLLLIVTLNILCFAESGGGGGGSSSKIVTEAQHPLRHRANRILPGDLDITGYDLTVADVTATGTISGVNVIGTDVTATGTVTGLVVDTTRVENSQGILGFYDTTTGYKTLADLAAGGGTGGTGTVTSLSAGTGVTLTPNPITTTGSIAIGQAVATTDSPTFANVTVTNTVSGIVVDASTTHIGQGTFDLAAQYDVDPDLWLFDLHADRYPNGIDITSVTVDCTVADPTTELSANLNYCDAVTNGAFPGANAVTIKAISTTTGNYSSGSMLTNVPTGKTVYITLLSDPTDATTQYHIRIHYKIL